MDYNEWSNYTAIGYLKFALEDYREITEKGESECRTLTEAEVNKIIGCMRRVFDMKTLKEAYDRA